MAQAGPAAGVLKQFSVIGNKYKYKQQAQFILNAYWKEHSKEAETVWDICQTFAELDKKGQDGVSLGELEVSCPLSFSLSLSR